MYRPQKAFTLVEIMIVVTIIVILGFAALLMLNPLTQVFKGYDALRKSDLDKLKIAFESYYEDHGCYPPANTLDNCGGNQLVPYLAEIPCDPSTKKPYKLHIASDEIVCPQNFAIYATLANIFDPNGHSVPMCKNTNKYVVGNTGARTTFLSAACWGGQNCSTWFGCKPGVVPATGANPDGRGCAQISVDYPVCGDAYCSNSCGGIDCVNAANECR